LVLSVGLCSNVWHFQDFSGSGLPSLDLRDDF
jgi:hypothetical protein